MKWFFEIFEHQNFCKKEEKMPDFYTWLSRWPIIEEA
jgi:hypothetical protein